MTTMFKPGDRVRPRRPGPVQRQIGTVIAVESPSTAEGGCRFEQVHVIWANVGGHGAVWFAHDLEAAPLEHWQRGEVTS